MDADAYWLELSRDIHRNSLEAGTSRKLTDFRWSSYRSHFGEDPSPKWLTTVFVLNAIGKRNPRARYAAFVEGDSGGTPLDFLGPAKRSPILSGDAFCDDVLRGLTPDVDRPQIRVARIVPALEQIVTATALRFGVEEDAIRRKTWERGNRGPARGVAEVSVSARGRHVTGGYRPAIRSCQLVSVHKHLGFYSSELVGSASLDPTY